MTAGTEPRTCAKCGAEQTDGNAIGLTLCRACSASANQHVARWLAIYRALSEHQFRSAKDEWLPTVRCACGVLCTGAAAINRHRADMALTALEAVPS